MERVKFVVRWDFWLFVAAAIIFKRAYFAALYTVAVVLHECAHYVVASKLFYHCTEIRLSIFGAVLYGDFADVAGRDRIKIALAGPLCNVAMCALCFALWWAVPQAYVFTEGFFVANAGMACVNMLPCYPLDGGRVLCGMLEGRFANALKLTKWLTVVVATLLFGLFVASLFTGHNLFSLGLFALCLAFGIFTSHKQCYTRTTFVFNRSRFAKKGMEKKTLVFNKKNKLSDVAKRMQGNFLYCLEVVNDDMQVVATFSVAELEQLVVLRPLATPLSDVVGD